MESKTLTIRIDAETYAALKRASEEKDRSLSWLCNKAIQSYFENKKAGIERRRTPVL